jgi:predicted AlkP superfamily phosphohydrolase/phosphomutase
MGTKTQVLAIGVDAAEPTLVRRLVDTGRMPTLKQLAEQGSWLHVESPANVGSGSVWPTLITGTEPEEHGVYGEWCWQPQTMSLSRYTGRSLKPFWADLAASGLSVGILDVPFATLIGLQNGFEITEWGAHDCLDGVMNVAPASITTLVNDHTPHPLSLDRLDAAPEDHNSLNKMSSGCFRGVQLRGSLAEQLIKETNPRLSLIVFPEIHHSAHHLWHQSDGTHEIYKRNGFQNSRWIEPTIEDIFCEIDRQIGELIAITGENTNVLVFSLHGMKATHGIPAFLAPLLCEAEFAKLADWRSKTWRDKSLALLTAVKRTSPNAIKKLYYKMMPRGTTYQLARTTMLPSYDWSQTRAFSLPSDQHGWIRLNVELRESLGIVRADQYDAVCDELEKLLTNLTNTDGEPLVRSVMRTCRSAVEAMESKLPDIIVHWEDAAFASPVKIRGYSLALEPIGKKFTGQHGLEGFCVVRGLVNGQANGLVDGDVIRAKNMGRLMMRMLDSEKAEVRTAGQ